MGIPDSSEILKRKQVHLVCLKCFLKHSFWKVRVSELSLCFSWGCQHFPWPMQQLHQAVPSCKQLSTELRLWLQPWQTDLHRLLAGTLKSCWEVRFFACNSAQAHVPSAAPANRMKGICKLGNMAIFQIKLCSYWH